MTICNVDFDALLGRLSVEEKIAQMMVLGVAGTMGDSWLWNFIRQYGLGGLRVSPNGDRRALRYLPEGAKGVENVNRPKMWGEKFVDCNIAAPCMSPKTYAEQLNEFRTLAFEHGGYGLPMHIVADCESAAGNFPPPYMMSMPWAMGFGDNGDLDLLERVWEGMARQYKAVGIDWLHSPVVDVNVNPLNPEISARSFGNNADVVTACAAANLRGLAKGNVVGTLKHYPGRGDSAQDAHFGLPIINASREDMLNIHVRPYKELIDAGVVESIMLAHTVFPNLDPDAEVATVSEFLIRDLLRGELGFDGVITTDSITMGGLMARYSVSEAAIRAVEFGVDLLLLKDENALRGEMFNDLVAAVKSGRISEERINESLLRIWKLKAKHGLFEKGGVVDPEAADREVADVKYRELSKEASQKVCRVLRMEEGVLPLSADQKILVVDRVTGPQERCNDFWNYPGMIYDFMRRYNHNITYCDYNAKDASMALEAARDFKDEYDVIVLLTNYNRGAFDNCTMKLIKELNTLGKTVIQITDNPYEELIIPPESKNVIITYGLMHEQLENVAAMLF